MSESSAYTGVAGLATALSMSAGRSPHRTAARQPARVARRATGAAEAAPRALRVRASARARSGTRSAGYATSGCSLYALIASCDPPSVAAERPPAAAGIARHRSGRRRASSAACISAYAYGQLRMNSAWPFWNANRLSSSCQLSAARGTKPRRADRGPHRLECSVRLVRVEHHPPGVVEHLAAERREILGEHGDEPFVARALPDQAVVRGRAAALSALAPTSSA